MTSASPLSSLHSETPRYTGPCLDPVRLCRSGESLGCEPRGRGMFRRHDFYAADVSIMRIIMRAITMCRVDTGEPSCWLRVFLLAEERMDCRSANQKMSQLASLVVKLGTAGDIYFKRRITTERPELGDIFTEF